MEGGEATAVRSKGRGPCEVAKEVGHTAGKGVCGERGGDDVCVCERACKIVQSILSLYHTL